MNTTVAPHFTCISLPTMAADSSHWPSVTPRVNAFLCHLFSQKLRLSDLPRAAAFQPAVFSCLRKLFVVVLKKFSSIPRVCFPSFFSEKHCFSHRQFHPPQLSFTCEQSRPSSTLHSCLPAAQWCPPAAPRPLDRVGARCRAACATTPRPRPRSACPTRRGSRADRL